MSQQRAIHLLRFTVAAPRFERLRRGQSFTLRSDSPRVPTLRKDRRLTCTRAGVVKLAQAPVGVTQAAAGAYGRLVQVLQGHTRSLGAFSAEDKAGYARMLWDRREEVGALLAEAMPIAWHPDEDVRLGLVDHDDDHDDAPKVSTDTVLAAVDAALDVASAVAEAAAPKKKKGFANAISALSGALDAVRSASSAHTIAELEALATDAGIPVPEFARKSELIERLHDLITTAPPSAEDL